MLKNEILSLKDQIRNLDSTSGKVLSSNSKHSNNKGKIKLKNLMPDKQIHQNYLKERYQIEEYTHCR